MIDKYSAALEPPDHKWLSVKEAADYLGCHPSFLNRDRSSGRCRIAYCRLGRHIRYDRADLDLFLQASRVEAARRPKRKRYRL